MAASSGLRENVYPVIFIAKMYVYIILFYYYYYYYIGIDVKANDWHRC